MFVEFFIHLILGIITVYWCQPLLNKTPIDPLSPRSLRKEILTSVFLLLCPLVSPTKAGCFNWPLWFLIGASQLDLNHSHSVNMVSKYLSSSFLALKTNFPTNIPVFYGELICGLGHTNSVFLVNYNGGHWYCLISMILPIICESRIFFSHFHFLLSKLILLFLFYIFKSSEFMCHLFSLHD